MAKQKYDQIFIRSGLKPSVWEYKNSYICYLPQRRTIIRSDQAAVPFHSLTRKKASFFPFLAIKICIFEKNALILYSLSLCGRMRQ